MGLLDTRDPPSYGEKSANRLTPFHKVVNRVLGMRSRKSMEGAPPGYSYSIFLKNIALQQGVIGGIKIALIYSSLSFVFIFPVFLLSTRKSYRSEDY